MKNTAYLSRRQVDKLAPAAAGSELSHLDGHCFKSERGVLGVALKPQSIGHLTKSSPSHWLVPLEDIAMVREAESLPGEVLWLSTRPPVEVVGQLSEDVRGAWLEAGSLVVNLDGHPQRLRGFAGPDAATPLERIAAAVVSLWKGGSPAALSSARMSHNLQEALSLCAV